MIAIRLKITYYVSFIEPESDFSRALAITAGVLKV